jgi:hypothetical protein
MKNILAENMLRFGPKNLTESERKNLQRLFEQSAVWDNVKPIGNNPDGPKEIKTNIPAATALTIDGRETKSCNELRAFWLDSLARTTLKVG